MAQVKFRRINSSTLPEGAAVDGQVLFLVRSKELYMGYNSDWVKFGDGDNNYLDVRESEGVIQKTIDGSNWTNVVDLSKIAAPNSTVVTVTEAEGSGSVLKAYTIAQGGTTIGTINIPKDLVVTSGSVVNGTWSGDTFTENASGEGKALKLVIANQTAPVYINPTDFIDVYTGGTNAEITVDVSKANVITATVGTIAASKVSGLATIATSGLASDAAMTGYATATATGDVADTDSAMVAIKKVEAKANSAISAAGVTSAAPTADSYVTVSGTGAGAGKTGDVIIGLTMGNVANDTAGVADAQDVKDYVDDKVTGATKSGSASAGTTATTSTAAASAGATVEVLTKVGQSNNEVLEVGSGSTKIAVDAAGAALKALNDAKAYADAITVNGEAQTNQNIAIDATHVDIATGYSTASVSGNVAAGDSIQNAIAKVEKKADAAVAKEVSASGDEYVSASASNNAVTVSADVQNLTYTAGTGGNASTLTGTANSLVDGADTATKVSSFVNSRISEELTWIEA